MTAYHTRKDFHRRDFSLGKPEILYVGTPEYNKFKETMNNPKVPHADVIIAYAKGEAIQYRANEACWWMDGCTEGSSINPIRESHLEWRIKPKYIMINGYEVPEPLRVAPPIMSCVYQPGLGTRGLVLRFSWSGVDREVDLLERGILHMTTEAAKTHADALLSFTRKN